MLSGDMDLNFSLEKNDKVNTFGLEKKSPPTITHKKLAQKRAILHTKRLILALTGGKLHGCFSQTKDKPTSGCSVSHLPLGTLT